MTSELQEETTADGEKLATDVQNEPTVALEPEGDTDSAVKDSIEVEEPQPSPSTDTALSKDDDDDIGDLLADVFEEESLTNTETTRLATILPDVTIGDVTAIVRGVASKMGLY